MMDLETLLTSPDGFGLESATFLQRAICRVTDGVPLSDLWDRGTAAERTALRFAIGCEPDRLPVGAPPLEVVDIAPVRTAKSLREAARSVARTQTINVDIVKRGQEPPRLSILATSIDTAAAIRGHLNLVFERPMLRALVVGSSPEGVVLRHPSGLPIEIRVVAAQRGGSSLAARWSAGVVFDEAPTWQSTDRIVSLEDSRDQVLGRLLPGAQAIYTGSPWQPSGFCFEAHRDHFGKPDADMVVLKPATVEGRTPAEWLNPSYWTSERVAAVRRRSPRTYKMHLSNNFGGSSGVFDPESTDRAFALAINRGSVWGAPICVIDASSGRKDSWTWCFVSWFHPPIPDEAFEWRPVADRLGNVYTREVVVDEHGIPKLNPEFNGHVRPFLRFEGFGGIEGGFAGQVDGQTVIARIAALCARRGARVVHGDQREAYMISGEFRRYRLRFVENTYSAGSKERAVARVRRWLSDGIISLEEHPKLRSELANFVETPTPGGGFTFKARGTGHDDFVCLLLTAALADLDGAIPLSPLRTRTERRFSRYEDRPQ